MNELSFNKIRENINKGNDVENTLQELIVYAESQYLKFWLTNITLDYITFLEVSKEKPNMVIIKQDETLMKVVKYIKKTLLESDKLFSAHNRGNSLKKVTTLKRYRDELELRVKALTAYQDKLNINEYIFNRLEGEFIDNYVDIEDDTSFAGNLIQFIFSSEDSVVINDKLKAIYGQLPVRLSKNRFYNHVDASMDIIRGVSKGDMTSYVDVLIDAFYPEGTDGYGKYFRLGYEELEKLDKIDFDNITNTEFLNHAKVLDTIAMSIDNATSYYIYVVSVINQLMGLLTAINEATIEENKREIDDFVALMSELRESGKADELINEKVNSLLMKSEGIMEDVMIKISQCDGLIETAKITYEEVIIKAKLSERWHNINIMASYMSASYFGDTKEEKDKEEGLVDALFLGQTKNRITGRMDEVFKNDSRLVLRARMAYMFMMLNVIQKTPQEVYEYILDALVSCKNEAEKNMSKRMMRQIINEYNV